MTWRKCEFCYFCQTSERTARINFLPTWVHMLNVKWKLEKETLWPFGPSFQQLNLKLNRNLSSTKSVIIWRDHIYVYTVIHLSSAVVLLPVSSSYTSAGCTGKARRGGSVKLLDKIYMDSHLLLMAYLSHLDFHFRVLPVKHLSVLVSSCWITGKMIVCTFQHVFMRLFLSWHYFLVCLILYAYCWGIGYWSTDLFIIQIV